MHRHADVHVSVSGGTLSRVAATLAAVGIALAGCPSEPRLRAPAWSLDVGGAASAPAMLVGGEIAVVTAAPELVVVHPDGALAWRTALSAAAAEQVPLAPVVLPGDDLVVASGPRTVARYSREGVLRWEATLPRVIRAELAALPDGSIVAACADGALVAVDPTGRIAWTYAYPNAQGLGFNAAPAVTAGSAGPTVTSVVGTQQVVQVSGAGDPLLWARSTSGIVTHVAAKGAGAVVYALRTAPLVEEVSAAGDASVVALAAPGVTGEPAVAADGTVHVVQSSTTAGVALVALRDGAVVSSAPLGAEPLAGVALTSDGLRVVRTPGVLAFHDGAGRAAARFALPEWRTAPALVPGAAFATAGSTLYRFDSGYGGLGEGPWPRPRGNNQLTGLAPGN